MRREPNPLRALHVPTREPGSPGPTGLALLGRGAHSPRRFATLTRRLLVAGGLLICGWLLGGLQSAHAADVAPPPAAAAGHPTDAVRAVTTHTAATRTRDHHVSAARAHSRQHRRHAATTAHRAWTRPAGAAVTRSSTPPARATSDRAVRDIFTATRQSVHQRPAATGTISRGTHARPSTRSLGSVVPHGTRVSRLAEAPVSTLAPALAHRAAPAPARPSHPPAASDLALALDSTLSPAPAPPAPPPATDLSPALRPAAAPPHPPPVLGRPQALGPPAALHALLKLGPAAALHDTSVLDPLPAFDTLARPPDLAADAIGTIADFVVGPLGDTTALGPLAALHGTTALDPLPIRNELAGLPGPTTALVTGPAGVLTGDLLPVFDGLVALPGSVPEVIGSVSGIITSPLDAGGAVAALVTGPVGVLAGPLGALVTTALDTKVLGALTAPLGGVLWRLGGLTGQLLSQVVGLLEPVARLLEPIDGLRLTGGGLAGVTPIGSLLPTTSAMATCATTEQSSTRGSWPTAAAPIGSGHVATDGSVDQLIAYAPVVSADRPLGVGPPAATAHVLCGQWPQPPHSPDVAHTHMSGQSGPFSPGDSNVPLSDTSNRALSNSSHSDGSGDTLHSWQARVPEAFVPTRIVAPPAVPTAADEPAFSPD